MPTGAYMDNPFFSGISDAFRASACWADPPPATRAATVTPLVTDGFRFLTDPRIYKKNVPDVAGGAGPRRGRAVPSQAQPVTLQQLTRTAACNLRETARIYGLFTRVR